MTLRERRMNYSDLHFMKTKGIDSCERCKIPFVFNDMVIIRRLHHPKKNPIYYHKICWEKLLQ